jgi:hypothetical protein
VGQIQSLAAMCANGKDAPIAVTRWAGVEPLSSTLNMEIATV